LEYDEDELQTLLSLENLDELDDGNLNQDQDKDQDQSQDQTQDQKQEIDAKIHAHSHFYLLLPTNNRGVQK